MRDSGFRATETSYQFGLEVEILPYYYGGTGQRRMYVTAPERESVIVNADETQGQAHSSSADQHSWFSDGIDRDEPRWELRNSKPLTTINAAIKDINDKMTTLKTNIEGALGVDLHFPDHEYYDSILSHGVDDKATIIQLKDEDQMHVQLNVTVPYDVNAPIRFGDQLRVMIILQYLQPFLIPSFCKGLGTKQSWMYGTTKLDNTFHTFVIDENGQFDSDEDSEQKRVLNDQFTNPHVLEWVKKSTDVIHVDPDFRYNARLCGSTQGTCNIFGFEMRFLGHVYPLEKLNVIERLIRQIHESNHHPPEALFLESPDFNTMFLRACDDATTALAEYKNKLIIKYPHFEAFIDTIIA